MASRATAIPLPALRIDRVVDPKSRVFQLTASNDGVSIFIPHPRFWWRNTVRFMKRARSKMQQAFAPLPLTAVFFSPAGLLGALYVIRHRNPQFDSVAWKVLERIQGYLPFAKRVHPDLSAGYVAVALTSVGIGGLTAVHRLTLRFVLSYTGWIDEGRGPKSLRTKMWAFLLRYVYIRGSLTPTYALQNCLPRLPVPPLQATMDRYLASMEPVLSPDELREVKEASAKFVVTEGPKLQRFLKFKYYTSRNYVSDWWLQVVYLRGRESLLINSNYYGIALYREPPTRSQAARAAVLTHAMLQVKASLDRELFPRTVLQDTVPLCMHQYVGIFGTTREPGSEIDRLTQYDSTVSRHVVVLHKGSFYKVYAVNPRTGHSLTRVQLYAAFQGILDAGAQQGELPREALFASLTTLPRTEWAEVRSNLVLRDTINRLALQAIEEALFCVCLDDQPGPWMDLTACGRRGIHGGGANLWLDKSFNVIITSDANVLCNAEHSWADAPTLSHVTELALQVEAKSLAAPGGLYAADGSIIATPEEQRALASGTLTLYAPERLVFNMTPLLTDACNRAFLNATKLINNLDLCCARFSDFGKGLIKKVKCSPDAFVQVALQLAYFRDQGRFVQTYESGTARLFLEGRTETIRSASTESVALVRAFSDARISKDEKLKLLRTACEKHQRTTALAMTGRGVDRHLFALYVVAVGTGVDSPFLSTAMRRGWKLSTSQIPQAVQDFVRPGDGEEWVRPAGGFGPVAEDGYGVCYTVSGETSLFFHVSCNRSCPTTDAARMQQRIAEALRDLASLVA